jgi:hypothetical protein
MDQSPSITFRDSLEEVNQLLAMHATLTGTGPGRRHNVEILNKSAIIFACAAFEAFIETLADRAFAHLVSNAADHGGLPKIVLQTIAESLKKDPHELRIWDLAGDGWKGVAAHYKADLIRRYIGPFNTPKPQNIEDLLAKLIGLQNITSHWKWPKTSIERAKTELTEFVKVRGALAHGQEPTHSITKKLVLRYIAFLAPLSVRTSNVVRVHCHETSGTYPWSIAWYGNIR